MFEQKTGGLISENDLANLERLLIANPERGDVIQGTGGCRKMRLGLEDRKEGKSGGARVIYYWVASEYEIYLLLAYDKHEQDDLTKKQKKVLKQIVKQELS